MQQLAPLIETHFSSGYASDDGKPRPPVRGFGALPGDRPAPAQLSEAGKIQYQIRQASSGDTRSKTRVRFLDAVLGRCSGAIERHRCLLSMLPKAASKASVTSMPGPPTKSDRELLLESHRFLRTGEDDDGSWEAKLAQRYYERLYREYVICDLAGYKKGQIGFRWRVEAEVVQGKGQFHCGNKVCHSKQCLSSYEVDFKYVEDGKSKRELVKVRLCQSCACRLHYRSLRSARKRKRKEEAKAAKRRRRGKLEQVVQGDPIKVKSESEAEDVTSEDAVELEPEEDGDDGSPDNHSLIENPSDADVRTLEKLAWSGPDPLARTREDDFDDYFRDLLA